MVLNFIPKEHQTLLFSATLPGNILKISERYLNQPERISAGSTSVPIAKIKQETLEVFKENKYDELVNQLLARKGSILVFVKTKRNADRMVKRLKEEGHSADAIHGDLRQSKRDRVINGFRKGIKRILIATDVAARGLDIPLIEHVINFDLPQVPEDYVHRIGRTARAGSNGSALTFLTRDDRSMWNSISKLIDPNFKSSQNNFKNNSSKNNRNRNSFDKKRNFRDKKKFFKKDDSRSSSFGDKKKFFKKDDSRSSSFGDKKKYSGYTNNPNYFGKKPVENSSSINEKKDFGFKKKKKFKNRSSRPKNFTFKKHSQKRKEF
jgi:ATP-dependent RNA helicase DeaD